MKGKIKENKKYIDLTAIAVGFIFLFNPNVNIIDYLPDFIGYIIITAAMVRLSDMNEAFAEARTAFKKMIIVDASRLFALLWVFGMSVTSERESSLLLWTFVFAVLDFVFLVPAVLKFFGGMTSLGYFHSNEAVIGYKKNKRGREAKRNHTDKIKLLTLFFVCFKIVMTALPEFAYLTTTETSSNYGIYILYENIGTLRFFFFVPVLVLGIVWIVKLFGYFGRIKKDVVFMSSIEKKYREEVLPKKGIFIKRSVRDAVTVLLFATVLTLDFRLDKINVFPDFVVPLIAGAAFFILSRQTKIQKKLCFGGMLFYFATALAANISELSFHSKYTYSATLRSEEALAAFYSMTLLACLSAVGFGVFVFCTVRALKAVASQHIRPVSVSPEHYEAQLRIAEETRREHVRFLNYTVIAAVLYAFSDVAYAALGNEYKFMIVVNVALGGVYVLTTLKAYGALSEAVDNSYMLE